MKKIITSDISTSAGMPIKSGTLDHLQSSYQEILAALAQNIIGNQYDPTKVYILYGVANSGSGSSYVISAGAIFYAGIVYLVDSTSFVTSGAEVAIGNIVTTYLTGASADPVQFTDGANHNIHEIKKATVVNAASGSGSLPDYSGWIPVNSSALTRVLVAAFGSAYTVSFKQDQSIFFTAGLTSGAGSINWDFTGAIPGTVVKMKLVCASGTTPSVSTPGGSNIVSLSGAVTANKTNYIDIEYCGKNDAGNHEVRYGVVSI